MTQRTLLILIPCLLLASCTSSHRLRQGPTLIYRSAPSRPGWITRLPDSKDFFYSTGIATAVPSLEDAKRQAVSGAVEGVVTYLGMRASVSYQEKKTELTTRALNQIDTSARARLGGAGLSEMYYEQYRDVVDGRVVASTFDVYVLLRIPQSELARERARLAQQKRDQTAQIHKLLQAGAHQRDKGRWIQALQSFVSAMGLADDLGDIALSGAAMTEAESLIQRLDLEMQDATDEASKDKRRKTVLIRSVLSDDATGIPLAGLPLKVRVVQGNRSSEEAAVTNARGEARVRFYNVDVAGAQAALEAEVDIERALVEAPRKSPSFQNKVQSLAARIRTRRALIIFPASEQASSRPVRAFPARAASSFPVRRTEGELDLSVKTSPKYIRPGSNVFIAIKVEMVAPEVNNPNRLPLNLALVMDRSGSMGDEGKLAFAKKAARLLIENLDRKDSFAFVTFDTGVDVIGPAASVTNRLLLDHKIDEIDARGTTNLSGGLFEGYSQITRVRRQRFINRILLLSDGIANVGITDPQELMRYAKSYAKSGVSITTIGVGTDYNEDLMLNLAEYSGGNYYFVKNPEDLPAIFERELKGLLAVAAQNITVAVALLPGVHLVNAYGTPHETKFSGEGDQRRRTARFRLGDLIAGHRKILLMELEPTARGLGKIPLANVTVSFDQLVGDVGRRQQSEEIFVTATRDRALVRRSADREVAVFAKLAQIAETFDLVIKSMDAGLHEKAHELLVNEYEDIYAFATRTNNRALLERAELVKHFAEELEELEKTRPLHTHDESIKDLRKNLQYKQYLLRHHQGEH